jgi:hypothetical protein
MALETVQVVKVPAGSTLVVQVEEAKPVTQVATPKKLLKFTTYVPSDGSSHTGANDFAVTVFTDGTGLCGCEDFVFSGQGTRNCKHINRAVQRDY